MQRASREMQIATSNKKTFRNEIHQIETNIKRLKQKKVHKEDAFKTHEFHHTMIERFRSVWKKIAGFEQKSTLSEADTDQLEGLKHQFALVLSADHQQAKLPHWGRTAQPGQTYYFQKISQDIFIIVNHHTDQNSIYLFNETIGPKNTDHTISFLENYLQTVHLAYPWINIVCFFLDEQKSILICLVCGNGLKQ